MTDPERVPGSHRRARGNNRLAVLIASLIGIAVVAVIVTITLDKRGEPARGNGPRASHNTLDKASPSSNPPSNPSSATPSMPTSSGSPSSGGSSSSPNPPGSSSPDATVSSTAPPASASLPALDVLNDSRITGLAARASATFRAAGWDVATTGNFRGADVPETTVFYPDGERAAADRLAAAFGIQRLLPASSGQSQTRLTVVLARDWAQHH